MFIELNLDDFKSILINVSHIIRIETGFNVPYRVGVGDHNPFYEVELSNGGTIGISSLNGIIGCKVNGIDVDIRHSQAIEFMNDLERLKQPKKES